MWWLHFWLYKRYNKARINWIGSNVKLGQCRPRSYWKTKYWLLTYYDYGCMMLWSVYRKVPM